MSGVRHGTRRQQLLELRDRIDQELHQLGVRAAPPPSKPTPVHDPQDPHVTVPISHVNPRSIRSWAAGQAPAKGPIPDWIHAAYRDAHR